MTNTKLIEDATKEAYIYLVDEGIYESIPTLRRRAKTWYDKTEIADFKTLAAVVMTGKLPTYTTTIEEIEKIKEFFYPTTLEYV